MGRMHRQTWGKQLGINNRFLWDYLKDRRAAVILYLSTVFIFVTVCSLYQMHNLLRLLYAFLLTCFIWGCYGAADFLRYIKKRRKIWLADQNLEQAADVLAGGNLHNAIRQMQDYGYAEDSSGIRSSEAEAAYEELITHLCQARSRLLADAELRRSEMADYYLMWAHQIKTPIAAMKLLLNGRDDSFLLLEELFKIEQYVEMVLHYLRLESMSSDMILKEYDLHAIVRQSVKKYSVLFINSGLSLHLEDFQATVLTDEKWLGFVLEQLISNSIKYTKKGGISVYMQKETLIIEDSGIGIKAEDLPRIFDRGFTGYNGRIDRKSTGIGLYLSKQVLKHLAHGIKISSKDGNGTKVYLDLSRKDYWKDTTGM